MASQLEVVKLRDIVEMSSVPRFVPGFEVPTIEIKGKDLRNVGQVVINDSPSPEFIIVNKTTIYAQLPSTVEVRSVELVGNRYTGVADYSKLDFEIGSKTRLVSGIQKLVQLFTKWILQSPGSDIFNPTRGGGLQDIVGQVTTSRNMAPILGVVVRAVSSTTSQIRSAQVNTRGLPLDERLLSAEVVDFKVFDQQMEARVDVLVRSVAGPQGVANVGL